MNSAPGKHPVYVFTNFLMEMNQLITVVSNVLYLEQV